MCMSIWSNSLTRSRSARALELFLDSLLTKACHVTQSRNAKTMTTSHLKQCIELEQQFDFLKDLVASVPDMQGENEDNHMEGDKAPRRGRKPGTGRRNTNGGAGSKVKDKKLSSTESEQEDESEESETDEEEVSRSSTDKPGDSIQSTPSLFNTPLPTLPMPTCSPVMSNLPMPAPAPMAGSEDGEEDDDYDS
ncbi:dr1-associated corepressor-like [Scyliorhinus canicula]|uniref:dr1-associated corepressor-like n=1 Tax=Scyliorhinus canicula TaxID=7830 RepID=UPI0018F3CA75|nr:dr1-associated corepressor-like [Scyliorhinus canicula]